MDAYNYYDIIIIGAGVSGLYAGYLLKKRYPSIKFIIIEENNKVGGRCRTVLFHDIPIVTGAGVGRKRKDKLLINLLNEFNISTNEFLTNPNYSYDIKNINILSIINSLKYKYNKLLNLKCNKKLTFKQFGEILLGDEEYNNFITAFGYSDFENADIYDTLYDYNMDDNISCWEGLSFNWNELINNLIKFIDNQIITNCKVINIDTSKKKIKILTNQNTFYYCKKLIISTTIKSVRAFFPYKKIYNEIEGQPFIRMYGKFSDSCLSILKKYIKKNVIVSSLLQKIIPINLDKGVIMIAYADNDNAIKLSNYTENNCNNRIFLSRLVEKSLNIPSNSITLDEIKSFYWNTGTHYYKPLDHDIYKNRSEFINKARHPTKNIIVVGEMVAVTQGWVEGGLESVYSILDNFIK